MKFQVVHDSNLLENNCDHFIRVLNRSKGTAVRSVSKGIEIRLQAVGAALRCVASVQAGSRQKFKSEFSEAEILARRLDRNETRMDYETGPTIEQRLQFPPFYYFPLRDSRRSLPEEERHFEGGDRGKPVRYLLAPLCYLYPCLDVPFEQANS